MTDKGPLLVAICTLGKVRVEWAMHISHAVMPVGRTRTMMSIQNMTTNDARNYACAVALELQKEQGYSRLMFWDDDILPRNQNAMMLLTQALDVYDEIDIISGVYPGRVRDVCEPIVVKEEGAGMWYGWRDENIHNVYMAGTGFMMMRIDALKKMDIPTYCLDAVEIGNYFVPDNEMEISDDVHLAKVCKRDGVQWFVHGGVVCDQSNLDGELFRIAENVPQLVTA